MDKEPKITPTHPIEQGPKILSFEEFSDRYNNFYLYFDVGWVAGIYKEKEHYKKFLSENPSIVASLCNKIQKINKSQGVSKSLEPVLKDLYEAYKIMRGYGVSDKNLFS